MLAGGCCDAETPRGLSDAYSRQLSQARPRTASTSLTLRSLHEGAATARWRPSKTRQKRIQFRHTPRVFGLTENLRNLRNLVVSLQRLKQPQRPVLLLLLLGSVNWSVTTKTPSA